MSNQAEKKEFSDVLRIPSSHFGHTTPDFFVQESHKTKLQFLLSHIKVNLVDFNELQNSQVFILFNKRNQKLQNSSMNFVFAKFFFRILLNLRSLDRR